MFILILFNLCEVHCNLNVLYFIPKTFLSGTLVKCLAIKTGTKGTIFEASNNKNFGEKKLSTLPHLRQRLWESFLTSFVRTPA